MLFRSVIIWFCNGIVFFLCTNEIWQVKNMTTVIITTGKEVISESEIQKLGLLGFECEIDPEIVGCLRDSSGKLLPLDCEILLEGNGGEVSAFGSLDRKSTRLNSSHDRVS